MNTEILSGKKVKIVGQPALNRLQYFMVGVKNTGEDQLMEKYG